jgi:signal transduction histidine kinase
VVGLIRDITERKLTEDRLLRQMEETSRRSEELEALASVSVSMRLAGDQAEMTLSLTDQAMCAMRATSGALVLLQGSSIYFCVALGAFKEWEHKRLDQASNTISNVIQDGVPRLFDCQTNPEILHTELLFKDLCIQLAAIIMAPLKSGPNTLGFLLLGFEYPQDFPADRQRLITAIADLGGSALHRLAVTETLEKMVVSRGQDLDTIYKVTSAASDFREISSALQNALEIALKAVNMSVGGIFLLGEGQGQASLVAQCNFSVEVYQQIAQQFLENSLQGWIIQNKCPLILAELVLKSTADASLLPHEHMAFTALPMHVRAQVVGVLCVDNPGGQRLNLDEIMLLSFIADHLGLEVENARLSQQSEQNAILEERQRLARELHDSVTQALYSATLYAAGAQEYARQGNLEQVIQYLDRLGQVSQEALKEMRLMVYELRSVILETNGLQGALQNRLDAVERRSGIDARLVVEDYPALLPKIEDNLYRIVLEALNNSLKHAGASRVSISIQYQTPLLSIRVEDDGIGFDAQVGSHNGGVGLSSMRERAGRIHGTLEIKSAPGKGSIIEVCVPIEHGYFALSQI